MMKLQHLLFVLVLWTAGLLAACTAVATEIPPATDIPTTSTRSPEPSPSATAVATTTERAPGTPACSVTAQAAVTLYTRPSSEATEFGTLSAGQTVQAVMRSASGWLGFQPGVAQAANVGVFRLRWVPPDAAAALAGACAELPRAPEISPTACYFMAMMGTPVYGAPDENSSIVAAIPQEGYAAVTGEAPSGWYRLDLADSSEALSGAGWLRPADANFNGPCAELTAVTP